MYYTPSIILLAGVEDSRTALLISMGPAAVNAAGKAPPDLAGGCFQFHCISTGICCVCCDVSYILQHTLSDDVMCRDSLQALCWECFALIASAEGKCIAPAHLPSLAAA